MREQNSDLQLFHEIKISTRTDLETALFIYKTLLDYVEKDEIAFEIKSKKGSISLDILINVLGGLFSAFIYDMIKKIQEHLREQKERDKKVYPIDLFLADKKYVLTGSESDILPKDN